MIVGLGGTVSAQTFSRDLRVDIALNQVGFTPEASKQCVLLESGANSFDVVRTDTMTVVCTGQLEKSTGDFGTFQTGDFSELKRPGTYYVKAGPFRSFPYGVFTEQDPEGDRQIGGRWYRYFMKPNEGWWVGINANIASAGIGLLRAAEVLDEPALLAVAQRQLDWIVGNNPFRASTIEGVGYNHPPQFVNSVEFYPPTPRLPGAVMNGLGGTTEDRPFMGEGVYHVSEYWTPMVAYTVWLMARLQHDALNAEP